MIDQRESFALGVCFYPEHWPQDRWRPYARQMRELGISYVRIAEFAWAKMEPRPGEFDWAWIDEAISVLGEQGLQVILCTPTATPPAWLVRAHPEILPVDREGRVREFGSRRHYEPASEIYRAESRCITTAIAERFGKHPAVVGWQTDNEFADHDTGRSWGEISPRLAAGALRGAGRPQSGLGNGLLEPGLQRVGADRTTKPAARLTHLTSSTTS